MTILAVITSLSTSQSLDSFDISFVNDSDIQVIRLHYLFQLKR
ncbi:hypothetical protein RPATATE_1416 [Rickettsia parkeri str. Tate's Hell]|uniref:Uncharacterized protein n=1 Tax=Rickettsia parkeri str. Tate's Hell TaxID=1359189 RepID=A0ABR5DN46_RICPA|nr:hypothetical protein RPAAT24_1107 [Rickettsia parkeri str. AT\